MCVCLMGPMIIATEIQIVTVPESNIGKNAKQFCFRMSDKMPVGGDYAK